MEKSPRIMLATLAIAGGLVGCNKAPGVDSGDNITATKETACMQCPDSNITRLDKALSCGSYQMEKGLIDAGTSVEVTENENGVFKDGKFLRVTTPGVISYNPENNEKVEIDQETICWVDASNFVKK